MKNINLETDSKIHSGFKVPEDYFENFSDRLIAKLPEKEVKVISIFAKPKTWIYAVAAVFVIGFSIPILNQYFNKSALDNQSIENYLVENEKLNENDIAELLTENDFQKIELDLKINNETLETELLGNENLEEYLIN